MNPSIITIKTFLDSLSEDKILFINDVFCIKLEIPYYQIYEINPGFLIPFIEDKINQLNKQSILMQNFNIKPNKFRIAYHIFDMTHRAGYELRLSGIKIDE